MDMWSEATRDFEREASERQLAEARIAVSEMWPFLAAAKSETDFANRLALISDRLAEAAPDPDLRKRLEASLTYDFKVMAENEDDDESESDSGGNPFAENSEDSDEGDSEDDSDESSDDEGGDDEDDSKHTAAHTWERVPVSELRVGDVWRFVNDSPSPFQVVDDPSGIMEGPLGTTVRDIRDYQFGDFSGIVLDNGNHDDVLSPDLIVERAVTASKTAASTLDHGYRDFFPDQLIAQIGRMNILAVSGGRIERHANGIRLPVAHGYAVDVFLEADDTYTVQTTFTRSGNTSVKHEWTGVYADEVGETVYQASLYRDLKNSSKTAGEQRRASRKQAVTYGGGEIPEDLIRLLNERQYGGRATVTRGKWRSRTDVDGSSYELEGVKLTEPEYGESGIIYSTDDGWAMEFYDGSGFGIRRDGGGYILDTYRGQERLGKQANQAPWDDLGSESEFENWLGYQSIITKTERLGEPPFEYWVWSSDPSDPGFDNPVLHGFTHSQDEAKRRVEQFIQSKQARRRRKQAFDALNTCNVCDAPIEHPNPMGYCDEHLREIGATEFLASKTAIDRTPPGPGWDSLKEGDRIRIGYEEFAEDVTFLGLQPNSNPDFYGETPAVRYRDDRGYERVYIPHGGESPRPARSASKTANVEEILEQGRLRMKERPDLIKGAEDAYNRQDQGWFNSLSTDDLVFLNEVNPMGMNAPWDDEVMEALFARGHFGSKTADYGGPSYRGDPRWITVRYPANCYKCGRDIKKGDRAFYYPKGKNLYCDGACGQAADRDFQDMAAVEDGGRYGPGYVSFGSIRHATAKRVMESGVSEPLPDGTLLDYKTAKTLLAVYDRLSPRKRAKFDLPPLDKLIELGE